MNQVIAPPVNLKGGGLKSTTAQWAYLHPGQMQVFRAPARYKVVVAGRRWGKCLASGSMISMADGSQRPIESIHAGDMVLTVNEDTYELEPRRVQHVHDNGIKETVTVKTAARSLTCTPNHPILANNRWVDAGQLKLGDLVAVPKRLAFGRGSMPEHEVDMLSIWLSEGAAYTISNGSADILDLIDNALRHMGRGLRREKGHGRVDWHIISGDRSGGSQAGTKNPLRAMLERFGVWGLNSKTKRIPAAVFELHEELLARFLNRFVACDGSICKRSKNTWALEIQLANEGLTRDLAALLHKFGIRGQIRRKEHRKLDRHANPYVSWRFIVSDRDSLVRFCERIGAIGKERAVEAALHAARASAGSTNDCLPISYEEMLPLLRYETASPGRYGGYNALVARGLPADLRDALNSWRKQSRTRLSRRRYEQLRNHTDGFFDPIADGDVAWEEVTAVERAEPQQTWDLTVEGNHNFIAEGLVTHNTQLAKTAILSAARKPKQLIWYVAPTYQMARQIMWQDLVDSIPRRWVSRMHETMMIIWLKNGTIVQLKGADKPDSLRGVGLHYVVLDEFQDMREETWTQVLRPTLASTGGGAMFIGTPKSFNHFYKLYVLGQRQDYQAAGFWMSWQFPTITSPFIPETEIQHARADMDEKSFRQEFSASFETMSNRVYHAFDRSVHVKRCKFDPKLPIWIGMDFNIDPMSAIYLQPHEDCIRVFGEKVIYNSSTEEMAEALDKVFWRHQKNILLYPDPAGKNRGHQRGESDLEVLRKQGFRAIKFRRKHPLVRDRVNAVNRMLKAADGRVRIQIDPSCKSLIQGLEQTQYKAGSSDIDKTMGVEHFTDAFGYPIELEFPVRSRRYYGASI